MLSAACCRMAGLCSGKSCHKVLPTPANAIKHPPYNNMCYFSCLCGVFRMTLCLTGPVYPGTKHTHTHTHTHSDRHQARSCTRSCCQKTQQPGGAWWCRAVEALISVVVRGREGDGAVPGSRSTPAGHRWIHSPCLVRGQK